MLGTFDIYGSTLVLFLLFLILFYALRYVVPKIPTCRQSSLVKYTLASHFLCFLSCGRSLLHGRERRLWSSVVRIWHLACSFSAFLLFPFQPKFLQNTSCSSEDSSSSGRLVRWVLLFGFCLCWRLSRASGHLTLFSAWWDVHGVATVSQALPLLIWKDYYRLPLRFLSLISFRLVCYFNIWIKGLWVL